jgi:hypothetical protein
MTCTPPPLRAAPWPRAQLPRTRPGCSEASLVSPPPVALSSPASSVCLCLSPCPLSPPCPLGRTLSIPRYDVLRAPPPVVDHPPPPVRRARAAQPARLAAAARVDPQAPAHREPSAYCASPLHVCASDRRPLTLCVGRCGTTRSAGRRLSVRLHGTRRPRPARTRRPLHARTRRSQRGRASPTPQIRPGHHPRAP